MCTKFWLESVMARPCGRPRRRWEENIEMDIREVVCNVVDWIQLT
jgi:hypothetical protein